MYRSLLFLILIEQGMYNTYEVLGGSLDIDVSPLDKSNTGFFVSQDMYDTRF